MENDEHKYGLPELKKYPMPDADHVRSAIKFFNYVTPAHEKELARAILKRMREYGMSFDDFTVGEENRFSKYIPKDQSLAHHGIKGQRWGVRRFQNEDGTLTEAGKKRLQRKDDRWVDRKADKIQNRAFKKSKREMRKFERQHFVSNALSLNKEKQGRKYMNEYNQKLAEVMNTKVTDIRSPSGKAVKFIAKRGSYGVVMALADPDYDMSQVKNGVWDSGRVAYQTKTIEKR